MGVGEQPAGISSVRQSEARGRSRDGEQSALMQCTPHPPRVSAWKVINGADRGGALRSASHTGDPRNLPGESLL